MFLSRAAVFYEQFVLFFFINGLNSVQGRKLGLNISIPEQAAQFPEHGKWIHRLIKIRRLYSHEIVLGIFPCES